MPLEAEDSYVADSTLSTSPQREASASPPIKRAARTYGRKRSPVPALDASSSPKPVEERPSCKPSRAAPRDTEESIPSTSDNEVNDGGDTESDSDASGPHRKPRNFAYGDWRKDLQDIDKQFAEVDSAPGPVRKTDGTTSATSSFGFGTSSLLSSNEDKRSTSPNLVNDIFGSSPADRSRPGPSKPDPGSDDDDDGEPFLPKKRLRRKAAAQDSDSEVEQPTTSPPVGTSPSAGPTLSPGSRRASETPPTSDNGMPATKLQRKGKGRTSFDSNRSVPQLELQDINEQKTSQTKKSKTQVCTHI
jgi:mediator of replication checkpoint protein 1